MAMRFDRIGIKSSRWRCRASTSQSRRASGYAARSARSAGTAVATALGWSGADWTAWAWLVVAVALAVAVRLIQHAVLRRPQPHAAPDVLTADDAIRSRSLHVLAGGGGALILIVVLQQLGAAQAIEGSFAHSLIEVARVLGVYPIAIAGWTVATATWPRTQPASPALHMCSANGRS